MTSGQLAALFPISVGAYQPGSTVSLYWYNQPVEAQGETNEKDKLRTIENTPLNS